MQDDYFTAMDSPAEYIDRMMTDEVFIDDFFLRAVARIFNKVKDQSYHIFLTEVGTSGIF